MSAASIRGPGVAIANLPTPLPAAIRTGSWAPWGYASPLKPGAKKAKVPVSVDEWGRITWIGTNTPEAWVPFEQAQKALAKVGEQMNRDGTVRWSPAGLGRLCSSEPELTVVDVDDCINAKGKLNADAAELVKRAATYTESSPSGRGLRLAFKGAKPQSIRLAEVGTVNGTRVEIYDAASMRYVTFTANALPGTKATVAAMSKGFAKWIAENWKRSSGSAARGSVRIVSEALLAELREGYEGKGVAGRDFPVIEINWTYYLKLDGGVDRSAAFAALFTKALGPEVDPGNALQAALHALGDDLSDKGERRVVIEETGEIVKVPFAIADAVKIAATVDERNAVVRALRDALGKVDVKDRATLVQKFSDGYPAHLWHIAYAAMKAGVAPAAVRAIVGDDTVASVAGFLARVRGRVV